MSKLGKKLISIPSGVEVKLEGGWILTKGSRGELKKQIPDQINVSVADGSIMIRPKDDKLAMKDTKAIWGLTRALVQNMVNGVNSGFEKMLEFQGVGYKATVKSNELELSLGYSHPITIGIPPSIELKVEKNMIKVSGIDKELIGKIAAEIRDQRLPEPYKGKGIKYAGEIIRRKAGKKAVASG